MTAYRALMMLGIALALGVGNHRMADLGLGSGNRHRVAQAPLLVIGVGQIWCNLIACLLVVRAEAWPVMAIVVGVVAALVRAAVGGSSGSGGRAP